MKRQVASMMLLSILGLTGCEFDVPITVHPTRKIELSLLGEWSGIGDCKDRMKVRKYDDSSYVFSFNETMYRAWHSDVGGIPFVTVQNLDSPERRYLYFAWSLTGDGKSLTLKPVKYDLFTKGMENPADVVKILRANFGSTDLFEDAATFIRKR